MPVLESRLRRGRHIRPSCVLPPWNGEFGSEFGPGLFPPLVPCDAAFELGIAKYALAETFAKLGSDAKLLIESIWPSFVQVLEIYAVSIGAGAVVGGLVGGLLGEGIGAVPGVAIGAELGIEVATALLYFLGIKFLAEYVLAHLGEAEKHFKKGCTLAWEARGDSPPLDEPAREWLMHHSQDRPTPSSTSTAPRHGSG